MAVWDQVSALFDPVVKKAVHGEFDLGDILKLAMNGHAIIGIAEEDGEIVMAMAFEFRYYPKMVMVNVIAIGGRNLKAVAARYFATFRKWAKAAGASAIEASCSPAMARLLERHGFEDTYRQVRSKL